LEDEAIEPSASNVSGYQAPKTSDLKLAKSINFYPVTPNGHREEFMHDSEDEDDQSFFTALEFEDEDYEEFNKSNPNDTELSENLDIISNFSIAKKNYGKTLKKIWDKKNDGSSKVVNSINKPLYFRGKKVIGFNPIL
jgi:hypothetical protein